ncbi:serine/threonine-protein kinase [Microbacterium sp. NPDC077644]|uniref:serine/threonine-protein kinase n=1 Tax=Microbacterium sp. NPDC077644 TaxID=3155055 RepID=UPI00344B157E
MTESTARHDGELIGTLLDERYAIEERLGEGGMGVVYRARDRQLGRVVAVKVFRSGATETERTASETRLLAGLNHPALVTLHDAHIGAREPRYIVMEHVDGPTLRARLDVGPLSPRAAIRLADDLADALHAVHAAGIVHRDVKPANVLLRRSEVPGEEFRAKLADFGIAHLVDTTRLTTPGTIIGSAGYLSPEQVTGSAPVPASDVYALGLVLLESLTGERAFAQDGIREAVVARLTTDPDIPASVGEGWMSLLRAMTAREPADRPTALEVVIRVRDMAATVPMDGANDSDATNVADTIPDPDATNARTAVLEPELARTAVLEPETGRSRRWRIPMLVAVVAAVVAIAGVALWNSWPGEQTPPPSLPTLEEPLAAHLEQLMDAVTP